MEIQSFQSRSITFPVILFVKSKPMSNVMSKGHLFSLPAHHHLPGEMLHGLGTMLAGAVVWFLRKTTAGDSCLLHPSIDSHSSYLSNLCIFNCM